CTKKMTRGGLRTGSCEELSFMESADFQRSSSNWGLFMKSIRPDRKGARFFKFNRMLQTAATAAIGGLFIAAGFILGGQAPGPFGAPQIAGHPGGAERYLTHSATGKPRYRTGAKLSV